ncbi:unnamed protein product [Effrenium voratum]|uniref:Apple domain-containing protein n=2 Tax=Effrenium voratum TaxID=2562239 RepID=A0AA36JI03_9DINO|nr:unnamed protein product [Effrenium voratum]CAJ1436166.1 unnamed protein product [Effrenium voratum]
MRGACEQTFCVAESRTLREGLELRPPHLEGYFFVASEVASDSGEDDRLSRELDSECHRHGIILWRSLVASVLLLGLAGLIFIRPSLPKFRGEASKLWAPAGWHKDPQGNDVKDTWDHFQMPDCDSGPAKGAKKQVPWDWHAKDNVLHPKRKLAELRGIGRAKKMTWVHVGRTKAQKECALHKRIAANIHTAMVNNHSAFVRRKGDFEAVHQWQGMHRCSQLIVNHDLASNFSWWDPAGTASAAHCQRACTWNPRCQGFSWNQTACLLKTFEKNFSTSWRFKDGVYSGQPCEWEERPYPWTRDPLQMYTLPAPKALQPAPNASMFCTMLVQPFSYEVNLAIMQYQGKYSIFACDNWAVYSSQRLRLAKGLATRLINSSQVCEDAGQFGTALNTEVFLAFWRAILLDGDYLKANWLVKADPDTVWFPKRLVPVLWLQEDRGLLKEGVYLNNCPKGLRGPLEVLSQKAFSTLATLSTVCYWGMKNWGDSQWGEDMWLDQCLMNNGHLHRVFVVNLLVDAACTKYPGWESCPSDFIGYHPFKQDEKYEACAATGQTTSTTATSTRTATRTHTATTRTTTSTTQTFGKNPFVQMEHALGGIFHR